MLKKILYTVIIIAIIVVLAIMWSDSNKEKVSPTANENITTEVSTENSQTSITDELSGMDINTGIDTDLNSMDADINTL